MEIRRTANAGVLLTIDGVKILLDGVCRQVFSYLPTPPEEKQRLLQNLPDAVAFTHPHPDHYDSDFAASYAEAAGKEILPTAPASFVGGVRIDAVPTRHMGKTEPGLMHVSFVLQGSKTVWFLGDAAPQQLKLLSAYPKPDVLIVPFPYMATEVAVKQIEALLPCQIVLVHMPDRTDDPDGIWEMVTPAIKKLGQYVYCPEIGENLTL